MRSNSYLGPLILILIVIGVAFLLSNLGLIPHVGVLMARWWPLILIAVGIYRLARLP